MLTGTPEMTVDGERHRLGPGDVVVANAGSTIRLDNPAEEPATVWVTTSAGLTATLAHGGVLTPPWAS